jgi:diadenosine tetraphosphatase ApaH/serine/threonine PP2A family protein phosphatase
MEYLLEDIRSGCPVLDTEKSILARLSGIGRAKVVLCGHSHVSRVVMVGETLVVNPGSVGIPAFRLDAPTPHIVEAGASHARYALVEKLAHGWATEIRAVPYDFKAAALQAKQAGRDVVAYSMRTGRVPPASV